MELRIINVHRVSRFHSILLCLGGVIGIQALVLFGLFWQQFARQQCTHTSSFLFGGLSIRFQFTVIGLYLRSIILLEDTDLVDSITLSGGHSHTMVVFLSLL